MMRRNRTGRQVCLVGSEGCTDAGVLNRIRRDAEINGRVAAIEDLDEVITEGRGRVVTSTINLADKELRLIVINDGTSRLWVSVGTGDLDEEGFVRLDQNVAGYVDLEEVTLLPLGDNLVLQAFRNVVAGRNRRMVLCFYVERNAAGGRGPRRTHREAECRRACVSFSL